MSKEKYSDDEILIRSARRDDMAAVADMIQELADFEKMADGPKLTVQDLQRDGFDRSPPLYSCLVAECAGAGASPGVVGYALYFPTYSTQNQNLPPPERNPVSAPDSTWEGAALMLEDLYVRVAMRRRGVGQRLFDAVAKQAHSMGCSRMDFHVLEWNDARAFYEKKGAVNLTAAEKWCYYRLAGKALAAVAGQN